MPLMGFIPDDIYKIIIDNSTIATVDIVCIYDNKILLGYRNNQPLQGVYYVTGGRVWKGEKQIDAVQRKAKEELGLSIDPTKLAFLGVYDDIFDNSAFDGLSTHCITSTYIYYCNEDEAKSIGVSDNQHSNLTFFDIDDASLHERIQLRIADAKQKQLL